MLPEKSDKTIALKGQINSTQWQRLGLTSAPNQTYALKGQIKIIDPKGQPDSTQRQH